MAHTVEFNEDKTQRIVTLTLQEYNQILNPPPKSGLGNPGPLGLAGFALTTFCLSVFNTGILVHPSLEGVVLPLALFYGGIAQFIAGLFEYKVNNTFGATAFCSYGAFWCSFAGYVYLIAPTLDADIANQATGLFLFAWMVFTIYMTIGAYRVSWAVFAVFLPLSITFILLTAGAFANNEMASHAGGWFGIFTAGFAWYASAAVIINSTWGRPICPIGVYCPPTAATKTVEPTGSALA